MEVDESAIQELKSNLQKLSVSLEDIRGQMNQLGEKISLVDESLVQLSQVLDEHILAYMKTQNEIRKLEEKKKGLL